jgi:hypothetical protein
MRTKVQKNITKPIKFDRIAQTASTSKVHKTEYISKECKSSIELMKYNSVQLYPQT